jgi:hypothetical protein
MAPYKPVPNFRKGKVMRDNFRTAALQQFAGGGDQEKDGGNDQKTDGGGSSQPNPPYHPDPREKGQRTREEREKYGWD